MARSQVFISSDGNGEYLKTFLVERSKLGPAAADDRVDDRMREKSTPPFLDGR